MLVDTDALPVPGQRPPRPEATAVLMADPEHFDVEYVINPHMEGNVGNVDRALAKRQWGALRDTYAALGLTVHVLPGQPGLPDLVFTANQSFPVRTPDGRWTVIMSRMRSTHRHPEVDVVESFYAERGAHILHLPPDLGTFESCGDCRWHPGRALIYGGHGFRTKASALRFVAETLDIPIVPLELVDPRFYHLDTCFSALDARTALVVPCAFSAEGLATLEQAFDVLIECPEDEAERFLACNGHCPDQKHFVVDAGALEPDGIQLNRKRHG